MLWVHVFGPLLKLHILGFTVEKQRKGGVSRWLCMCWCFCEKELLKLNCTNKSKGRFAAWKPAAAVKFATVVANASTPWSKSSPNGEEVPVPVTAVSNCFLVFLHIFQIIPLATFFGCFRLSSLSLSCKHSDIHTQTPPLSHTRNPYPSIERQTKSPFDFNLFSLSPVSSVSLLFHHLLSFYKPVQRIRWGCVSVWSLFVYGWLRRACFPSILSNVWYENNASAANR